MLRYIFKYMIYDDPKWHEASELYKEGDWAGSLILLRKLAKNGFSPAYTKIAGIYEFGYNGKYGSDRGVQQNFKKALKWYRKAHYETNNPYATLGLGRMYFDGKGVKRDFKKALKYFDTLKHLHIAEVYYSLGFLDQTENGVEKDVQKAVGEYTMGQRVVFNIRDPHQLRVGPGCTNLGCSRKGV